MPLLGVRPAARVAGRPTGPLHTGGCPMKPVLAGSLLALGVSVLGAPCSHAAIGDIVAVLRASSVRPVAPSARGTMTTEEARRLPPEASLAITLSTPRHQRATAPGAETGAP